VSITSLPQVCMFELLWHKNNIKQTNKHTYTQQNITQVVVTLSPITYTNTLFQHLTYVPNDRGIVVRVTAVVGVFSTAAR